jgi:two-component system, response regulator
MNDRVVLVVDDDPDDRWVVKQAFKEKENTIRLEEIQDGQELIDWLTAGLARIPDLIMLDLNLPRVTGHEAIKFLKESPLYRHIPVVVFSTSSSEFEKQSVITSGANGFFQKPSTYNDYIRVLRAVKSLFIG